MLKVLKKQLSVKQEPIMMRRVKGSANHAIDLEITVPKEVRLALTVLLVTIARTHKTHPSFVEQDTTAPVEATLPSHVPVDHFA